MSQLVGLWFGCAVLIMLSGSQCWKHVVKPYIGSELWFLPTPPAFDALVSGFPSKYRHNVWCQKTRMVWLPDGEKIEDTITRFDIIHERDGQKHTDTSWRHKLHCIASHGNYPRHSCHVWSSRGVFTDIISQRLESFFFKSEWEPCEGGTSDLWLKDIRNRWGLSVEWMSE